jgi:peptidyl-prolyl cis-trans isomerase C
MEWLADPTAWLGLLTLIVLELVLAKKYSTCPSGKRGGDLGEVRPGQMVGAIDAVIFKKPVKVVHGPIKSKFGYHLVQVFYRD